MTNNYFALFLFRSKIPTGALLIRTTQIRDAGSYICYAKNKEGEVSALRNLQVYSEFTCDDVQANDAQL